MVVYAVVDDSLSPEFPLGNALEIFVRREDAERFIEEARSDDPALAKQLRIEQRELNAGGAQLMSGVCAADRIELPFSGHAS